jgi:hypothetical protein
VRRSFGRLLLRRRPFGDAAGAPVIADVVFGHIIRHVLVVHVRDIRNVCHISDAAVVIEIPAAPFAACVAVTEISESVINAAVEPDGRAPVSNVKYEGAAAPSPIAGCPQQTNLRRHDPGSGNPEISTRPIIPITGSPKIAGLRTRGLSINRQRRRPKAH